MTKDPLSADERFERKRKRIARLRMLDDVFMRVVLKDNIPAVQDIVRALLRRDDIVVVKVITQDDRTNLKGRSVCLDVLAHDSKGNRYNIEIQRDGDGVTPKRARYHFSMIDWDALDATADFHELPETWVIFITEDPKLTLGRAFATKARVDLETGEIFEDGQRVLIVNALYEGDDSIGLLMSDFRATDPDTMHFSSIAERATYLKKTRAGVREMTDVMKEIMRDICEEEREEGRAEGLAEGLAKGEARGLAKGEAKERSRTVGLLLATFSADSLLNDPMFSRLGVTQAEIDAATAASQGN